MEPESTQELVSTDNKKTQPPKKYFLFRFLSRLLVFISLGVLLGVLFMGWQIKQTLTTQQNRLSQSQTEYLQLQNDYQHFKQTFTKNQEHFAEQLFAEQNTVHIKRIKQLIYLGYYNFLYLKNNSDAITALTLANQQLREITSYGSEVENLRRLLSEKLTQLQMLPVLDRTAILAQLNTLQTQVITLPLRTPHATVKNTSLNPSAENHVVTPPTSTSWLESLRDSLQHFKQLIVIRHVDQPIEPLLPEDQTRLLEQRLQLSLQQTQWALLHSDDSLYQLSLTTLQNEIQRYFDVQAHSTKNTLAMIDQLKKVSLSTSTLDFKPMLSAIDALENYFPTHSSVTQSESST